MQQLHIPRNQDQFETKRNTSKLSTTNTHIAEPLLSFFFGWQWDFCITQLKCSPPHWIALRLARHNEKETLGPESAQ